MTTQEFQAAVLQRLDNIDRRFDAIDAHDQEIKSELDDRFDRLARGVIGVANQVPMLHQPRAEIVELLTPMVRSPK